MRKTLLSGLFLTLCATWIWAQQTSGSQSTSSGNETTVQGCLNGSGGNYMLSDKSGKTYQLEGDTSKLSAHVGQEVKVTGTESAAPSSASSGSQGQTTGGSAATESKATFKVSNVEQVSATCSATQK